jgi:hypothetical protein
MVTINLKSLRHGVSTMAASEEFRAGLEQVDFTPYLSVFPEHEDIDMSNVDLVLEYAMRKFDADPKMSDAWVAPRLHAALRISRRTASDRGIWRWLAMVHAPGYVRWRWGKNGKTPVLNRFDGEDKKQTFARLWWTAELCRNGPDYSPVVDAFKFQDFVNSCVCATDLGHHRPSVHAILRAVLTASESYPPGDAARAIPKAVNLAASTRLLDAIGPDEERPDIKARQIWRADADQYDARDYLEVLPPGPKDEPVEESSIAAVRELVNAILADPTFDVLINDVGARRNRVALQIEAGEDGSE